jgi:hypothetical protein
VFIRFALTGGTKTGRAFERLSKRLAASTNKKLAEELNSYAQVKAKSAELKARIKASSNK